ncbi:MAG: hypothetical protein P1V20_00260 [Verrucomicrobiales bacterium]|nr:hypothetical protein [Verrucomicrobiales bacterium]
MSQNLSNDSLSSRRQFIAGTTLAFGGFYLSTSKTRAAAPSIVGHGDFRYEVVKGWGNLDPAAVPVANCHEMVEDSKGRLILFQTDTKNNIVIYDKSGKLLETWGTTYKGAHGLDIVNENGEDFLFLTDTKLGKVFKTKMDGKVVMELGRPDIPQYADPKAPFRPTNVMTAPDGSFYVGDGYGSSWVMQYDQKGKLQNVFGGKGTSDESLNTPHGGIVDTRNPERPCLMICSRSDNALKRFTLSGIHLQTIPIPGMRVCQLAMRENYMVAPHLEGLISVIDSENKVVSNPGGSKPVEDADGNLEKPGKEGSSPFTHPHGVWVDAEHSVYIPQWNSGKTYPIKLKRVG